MKELLNMAATPDSPEVTPRVEKSESENDVIRRNYCHLFFLSPSLFQLTSFSSST